MPGHRGCRAAGRRAALPFRGLQAPLPDF